MAVLTEAEKRAWKQGLLVQAHKKLGAHCGGKGVHFCVWAPNARAVAVVGDFNNWNRKTHSMDKHSATGIWEIEVPNAAPHDRYKFLISSPKGKTFFKSDPYAKYTEGSPYYASLVYPLDSFDWSDEQWLKQRSNLHQYSRPLSIYELHLGSWKRLPSGKMLNYRQLATKLIPYIKKMGFTHIELMPVMEHPYLPSWGYQITNYFAPSARYGTPDDLMYFIDACHQNNIGVLLDWVSGHFPRDPHGLNFFDGTPLYEHGDVNRREHADWGTHNFDLDKPEVRSFLLSNAFFWCDKYHVDGLRCDAVASMLNLDYSRKNDEWVPNIYGGNEHLGAIAFLQDLNRLLHEKFPSVLTIAEESSEWRGVTHPIEEAGLGFDYKWNMGWMNDSLHYFELSAGERLKHSGDITFPITHAFEERFILPLSHDEVVHLKQSLWSKMPGNSEQKFKQLKQLFLYMIGLPGKKLLFMGSELAPKREWSESRQLNWALLKQKNHKQVQIFLQQLLHFYRFEPALFASDDTTGFCWINLSQKEQGVFSFSRGQNSELLFCFNFSNEKVQCTEGKILPGYSYYQIFDSLKSKKMNPEIVATTFPVKLDPFQGIVLRREEF